MRLKLGYSPCPNDTFIFYAMAHQAIDTEGLKFDIHLADVEALNQDAFRGNIDITKLSFHAFAKVIDQYALLDAGSALGKNCGPLLIAKKPLTAQQINEGLIAIPGENTTANFLLSLAYPEAQRRQEFLFSDIEQAVLDERVTTGLIIHENRFTYQEKGLVKLLDLGEYWETTTGLPIPLGGIVVRRDLPGDIQQKVNRVLQRSVRYAFDHPEETKDYVRQYAQEMSEEVMFKHIGLYVNDFTENLGVEGRKAVDELMKMAVSKGIMPQPKASVFLSKVG